MQRTKTSTGKSKSKQTGSASASAASGSTYNADQRLRDLLAMATKYIESQIPSDEEITLAAHDGPSMVVFACHPPSKDKDGHPVYPAAKTHFAGFKDGTLADPKVKGVPWVALLQGFPTDQYDGRRRPDPRTLPGGRTVVDLLNAWILKQYSDPDHAPCFRLVFRGMEKQVQVNRLELQMVWDTAAWDEIYNPRRRAPVAASRSEPEPAAGAPAPAAKEMSYEEWTKVEQARRAKMSEKFVGGRL
jgi:hypothetical protein